MNTLIIQHVPGDEARFHVVRQKDGKRTTEPSAVRSPTGFAVEGRPDSDLVRELRWYLEEFLDYPFSPETERADRVLDALKQWGRQAFDALFDSRQAGKFLDQAAPDGQYDRLHLQISSDDPGILAWPWEALRDSAAGLLAQQCQIERRLNRVLDAQPIHEGLPRDRVNILLVTARPHENDVRYRSISRPLVELIQKRRLAAHVTVLRPPTFEQLRRHLREHAHHYHILHFDGHGGYGQTVPGTGGSHIYKGSVGCLVFEDVDGTPDEITADRLSDLLRETAVPVVVLNACRSAMIDDRAEDPFASVATSLLRSGTRSVVAMAYSLYVSGAQQFLPAFYERLFEAGDVAQAVRAGRQQMYAKPGRICARGEFPLHDWLVPVVYQQDPLDFSFAAEAKKTAAPPESKLPEGARDEDNPYGFIGRDGALQALERAMLRPPGGILITGLGGVGKTTLARGFVQWLAATEGLGHGCLWLNFTGIRSAEFVVNRMGEAMFGDDFAKEKMDTKLDALAAALRENRVVIVWDNFEVVRGIPGTSVTANLTDEDRDVLRTLLKKLRGGASKVIITSRAREEWLGHENCFELPIGGLAGDERWDYCEAVLKDLGLSPKRDDPAMVELMELLGGHTLAMRAILPKLKDRSAPLLVAALRNNLDALELDDDEISAKLRATLRFVEDALPDDERRLLIPLGLHERFIDANLLEHMAKQVDGGLTRAVIDRFTDTLCFAGLLRDRGQSIFEMHPTLTAYLRTDVSGSAGADTRDSWTRSFVDVMGGLADELTPRPIHEQRVPFLVHSANFHYAMAEAERLGMEIRFRFLLQALATQAENTREFASAARLHVRRAEEAIAAGEHESEAAAYHQLGIIALENRDFAAAEQWCRKSLAISEKQRIDDGAARNYHQLGMIAQGQRDFDSAGQWYRRSLAISEKQRNEDGAARTYHQLGMMAQEQRDFAAAEQWCRRSLAIKKKQGDEYGAAITYHQLGIIAQQQEDFAAAEQWYRKSLAVQEKQGNERGAAIEYHHLGTIAHAQRDFATAERLYRMSLAITEKHGDELYAASTYHGLGLIAEEQRDFIAAEQWYRKSLAIEEKQCNEHGAAVTYAQLGILAWRQEQFEESGRRYVKGMQIFTRCNDERAAQRTTASFMVSYGNAPPGVQAKLETMWREAGFGDLPSTDTEDDKL